MCWERTVGIPDSHHRLHRLGLHEDPVGIRLVREIDAVLLQIGNYAQSAAPDSAQRGGARCHAGERDVAYREVHEGVLTRTGHG